ncbi:hypothetical protein F511_32729 [Dorcoceras hygrometricum]|uniref:Integrase catalytic domain-containing protein n=1 Tax=Dorcoceras hygrometricum TaxID=472368 RepID=A0A2Z7CE70_9LAMI|nr:hypothetical protein F511_32729 [Dorcoceras hygrometricum]
MGNGTGLPISHIGESHFCSSSRSFVLTNLLRVPHISKNIISVSNFAKDNRVFFEFHPDFCLVKDLATRVTLLKGSLHKGLYKFDLGKHLQVPDSPAKCLHISSISPKPLKESSLNLWHFRLGHPTISVVKQVFKLCKFSASKNEYFNFCTACELGKSHRLPFSLSQSCVSEPLELIYSDVWGPSHTVSRDGFRYYVSFVDAFSRYTWIYFTKLKFEVPRIFETFKSLVELQFNKRIKNLQTDWGGEFRSLTSFLQEHGIQHRVTCPHTSEQNGVVERKHRHVVEIGLTLLAHASMPLRFWPDAFSTAVYLINRLPFSAISGNIPFKLLYKKCPDYSFLKVFGSLCFPCLRPFNHHKLEFRSTPCTFLGYSKT